MYEELLSSRAYPNLSNQWTPLWPLTMFPPLENIEEFDSNESQLIRNANARCAAISSRRPLREHLSTFRKIRYDIQTVRNMFMDEVYYEKRKVFRLFAKFQNNLPLTRSVPPLYLFLFFVIITLVIVFMWRYAQQRIRRYRLRYRKQRESEP